MGSKLHQNAIITGHIDSYCLVCESYLRSEESADRHIEKPVHKKNLDGTQFVEKFKNDRIRKVKKGYFCEFCNILLSTATKIGIHLANDEHIATKGLLLLKPQGNGVVAYNNILIKDKAWHSLTEDTCAICNTEFDNAEIHKNAATHLLKLVQNKVEFGAKNSIYRRIDNSTFQCLTCNTVLALNTIEKHFNDQDHDDMYLKCLIEPNVTKDKEHVSDKTVKKENVMKSGKMNQPTKAPVKQATPSVAPKPEIKDEAKQPNQLKMNAKKTETEKKVNKSKILDSVAQFQKNEININFEIETAFCKKCFVIVSFDFHDIEKHIVEHKTVGKSASHPSYVNQNHNKTKLSQDQETPLCTQPLQKHLKSLTYNTDTDSNHHQSNSQTDTEEEIETIFTSAAHSRDDSGSDHNEEYVDIEQSNENDESLKQEETALNFAKENHITYNTQHNNAYCRVCKKKLPSSLRSMKEHASGVSHKSRVAAVAASAAIPKLPKKPSKKFLKRAISIANFYQQDVVVNDKYCLTQLSYLMISKHDSRLRCQACEVSLAEDGVEEHTKTSSHEKAMEYTPVVTYYDSEFIREIRPGLFHCGYCNLIPGDWSEFEKHVKCPEHESSKTAAEVRMARHLPLIVSHRREKSMNLLRSLMLGQFGPPFF